MGIVAKGGRGKMEEGRERATQIQNKRPPALPLSPFSLPSSTSPPSSREGRRETAPPNREEAPPTEGVKKVAIPKVKKTINLKHYLDHDKLVLDLCSL